MGKLTLEMFRNLTYCQTTSALFFSRTDLYELDQLFIAYLLDIH